MRCIKRGDRVRFKLTGATGTVLHVKEDGSPYKYFVDYDAPEDEICGEMYSTNEIEVIESGQLTSQMEVVQLLQMQFMQLSRNSKTTRAAFIALMALPTYRNTKLTDKVHRLVWYGSDYREPHFYDGNYWTEKDFHCLCAHFALQLAGVE